LISCARAQLQPSLSLPIAVIAQAAAGVIVGYSVGVAAYWIFTSGPSFESQHVESTLGQFGSAVGLLAVLLHRQLIPISIEWLYFTALVLILPLSQVAIVYFYPQSLGPLSLLPVATMVPVLLTALFFGRKRKDYKSVLIAVFAISVGSVIILVASDVSAITKYSWRADSSFRTLGLILASLATWPLLQRTLSDEPSPADEPPEWRPRPISAHLWLLAPLVLVTMFQIPIIELRPIIELLHLTPFTSSPLRLDLPSLVVPIAIVLGWRFGLRGWRTALLMVLPALWFSAPEWITPVSVDVAATALLAAALFARPMMFSHIVATSQLPRTALLALAVVLCFQVSAPTEHSAFPLSKVPELGSSSINKNPPQASNLPSALPNMESRAGWIPNAFVVLSLFLIGSGSLGRQGLALLGAVAIAGLVSPLLQFADVKLAVLPIPFATAVAGVFAYLLGRSVKRLFNRQFIVNVAFALGTLTWFTACFFSMKMSGEDIAACLSLSLLLSCTAGFHTSPTALASNGGGALYFVIGLFGTFLNNDVMLPFLLLGFFVIGRRSRDVVLESIARHRAALSPDNARELAKQLFDAPFVPHPEAIAIIKATLMSRDIIRVAEGVASGSFESKVIKALCLFNQLQHKIANSKYSRFKVLFEKDLNDIASKTQILRPIFLNFLREQANIIPDSVTDIDQYLFEKQDDVSVAELLKKRNENLEKCDDLLNRLCLVVSLLVYATESKPEAMGNALSDLGFNVEVTSRKIWDWDAVFRVTGCVFLIMLGFNALFTLLAYMGVIPAGPAVGSPRQTTLLFTLVGTVLYFIVLIVAMKSKKFWYRDPELPRHRPENVLVGIFCYLFTLLILVPLSWWLRGELTYAPFLNAINQGVIGYFIGVYIDRSLRNQPLDWPLAARQGLVQAATAFGTLMLVEPIPGTDTSIYGQIQTALYRTVESGVAGFLIGYLFQYFYRRARFDPGAVVGDEYVLSARAYTGRASHPQ
jgi:hypothetical protein